MKFVHDFRTNCDLFSNQYLDEHLPETDHWQSVDTATLRDAYNAINELWERERDESQLEETFIRPMFRLLGIPFEIDESTKQGQRSEYVFYQSDEAARNVCDSDESKVAIAHTGDWNRNSDTREERDFENSNYWIHKSLQETPLAWAVLTNGRYWRLYHRSSDYVIDTYYEIDLPAMLESSDIEIFKYFYLFFRHEAFLPGPNGDCFLDYVYYESDIFAQELREDLQDNIHKAIETLAEGFLVWDNDLTADDLERIYDSAIVYLYRLICILYGESETVTENCPNHTLYAITQEVIKREQPYQRGQDDLWDRIHELFQRIEGEYIPCESPKCDPHILFPYGSKENNSLEARFLATHKVNDAYLARVIEFLTRTSTRSVEKTFIDYSTLDVNYLGWIYENLLEYELNIADESLLFEDRAADSRVEPENVHLTTDSGERKTTGSYYTPGYVIEYIVENTLEPLIDDIRADVSSDSDTGENEFVERFVKQILELNVLDPAMGCGAFLRRVVDYLAYQIIDAQETHGETIGEEYDIDSVRQQIIQHCIYGVDRDPLAVELANVSLWLRTLDSEQPPVALDHHLKTGNSLVGSDLPEELEPDREDHTAEETTDNTPSEFRQRLEAIANVYTADEFGLDGIPDDVDERMARAVETDACETVENDAWETIERAQWFQDAQHVAAEDDYFHWELEFPDVLCDGTGFDAVIGNPPYVRIQNLKKTDPATTSYLENAYETTHRNYDLSVPFTEKGYELLREGGCFGYIETKKWIQGEYGEKLREYLIKHRAIYELVDFSDQQIFPGASTYTQLLFLRKCTADAFCYANINDVHHTIDQLRRIQTADQFVDDDMQTYRESFDTLGPSPWVFTLPEEREILDNIERHPTLGSITNAIFVGLQTSADAVYIVEVREENGDELRVYSNALDRTCTIEKGVTRPILRGSDIEKWSITECEYRIIFPYRTNVEEDAYDLLSKQTIRRNYPNTWRYLNENRSQLLGRADVHEEAWWGYPYPKNLEKFGAEKLMTQVLANQSSLAIDRDGVFAFVGGGNAGGYGITVENRTIRYEALLALLNSSLLEWKLKKKAPNFEMDIIPMLNDISRSCLFVWRKWIPS